MGKVRRWNTSVPCPRMVRALGEEGKEDGGDDLFECEGSVRVYGYYDEGRTYGDPYDCYPPEGEENADACDTCGFDDWTVEQVQQMTEDAMDSGDDDGPEPPDADDFCPENYDGR